MPTRFNMYMQNNISGPHKKDPQPLGPAQNDEKPLSFRKK